MKIIILSAGTGSRLWPLTKDRPKILVDLGDGTTVLSRQVETISKFDFITDINIGSGYCVDKVESAAKILKSKKAINIIYNPFYDISGPLVTFWLVQARMDDSDYIVINGDTLFSNNVYEEINNITAACKEGIWLAGSKKDEFTDDEILIQLDKNDKIKKAGKNLSPVECSAVSAGMLIVKGKSIRQRISRILEIVARKPEFLQHNKTWHSFLNDLTADGMEINFLNVNSGHWAEVDLHLDLNQVQNMLKSKVTF